MYIPDLNETAAALACSHANIDYRAKFTRRKDAPGVGLVMSPVCQDCSIWKLSVRHSYR